MRFRGENTVMENGVGKIAALGKAAALFIGACGMCLDVGHANLSDIAPIEWLRRCAPYISHYHIHNNFGAPKEGRRSWGDRHLALGNGNIDMKALLDLAEELTPDATAAIESYAPEDCVAWLKENGFI